MGARHVPAASNVLDLVSESTSVKPCWYNPSQASSGISDVLCTAQITSIGSALALTPGVRYWAPGDPGYDPAFVRRWGDHGEPVLEGIEALHKR